MVLSHESADRTKRPGAGEVADERNDKVSPLDILNSSELLLVREEAPVETLLIGVLHELPVGRHSQRALVGGPEKCIAQVRTCLLEVAQNVPDLQLIVFGQAELVGLHQMQ